MTAGDLLAISPTSRPTGRRSAPAAGPRPCPARAAGRRGTVPTPSACRCASRSRVRRRTRALAARLWPILRDGARADRMHPLGWAAAAAAASAAGDRGARDRLLDRAQAAERAAPGPAGAAWVALARITLQTGRLEGCALDALR